MKRGEESGTKLSSAMQALVDAMKANNGSALLYVGLACQWWDCAGTNMSFAESTMSALERRGLVKKISATERRLVQL